MRGDSRLAGTVWRVPGMPTAPLDDMPPAANAPLADHGARYWRCDLQVHTPKDARWPEPEPRDGDQRRALARRYLEAAKQRGIDVVGVTEHHDVSWIDEMRYAAKGLGLHVLPGFEVETSEGVHVLCLFDCDRPVVDLDDALTTLGLDRGRRDRTKLTEMRAERPLAAVLDIVQNRLCGVCIAAHVTSSKGLLNLPPGGARADAWKHADLLAVQVSRPIDEISNAGVRSILENDDMAHRRDRPVACLLTSDARSIETIGTVSTYVKMHHPSAAGLRQAFLDPASRIAFDDPMAQRSDAHILTVAWEGGYLRDSAIALNAELTCLIGGKGTGKSTVVESIRWAFGFEPETDEGKAAVARLRKFVLPAGSKVSVTFRTQTPAPKIWKVERTAPHGPIVRDSAGTPHAELTPTDLLRPRVYGQKEIFDVAQNTQARLALVDRYAAAELRATLDRERDVLALLRRNGQDLLRARERADDAQERLAELPALLQWRERFRQAGLEERLRERRMLDREDQLLQAGGDVLRARQRALATVVDDLPLMPDLSGGTSAGRLPNVDLLAEVGIAVREAVGSVDAALASAQRALAEGRERLGRARDTWAARRAARQADFDRALRDLQSEAPEADPEQYLDVERRIEQLEPLRQTIEQLEQRVHALRRERQRLLVELQDVRGDRHRRRVEAAARLTRATGDNVRVSIGYEADRVEALELLQARRSGVRADQLARLVDQPEFSPTDFAGHLRGNNLRQAYGLPEAQGAKLTAAIEEAFLLEFETLELRDGITIELDVGDPDRSEFRDLDRLSPGQKSTAILLLILRSSIDPLIIDQPEDDLDNRFIYDDVVQRLRSAKRTRQILVATHNANIPILGDAEQIIVLEGRGDGQPRGYVRAHGTVDDEKVRSAAERILEGGEEAFRRRREKYGW